MKNRSEWIWWNGNLVPSSEANVHVSTHALHYGSSVFEGIRAYETPEGPALLGLAPHLKRFAYSSKVARLKLDFDQKTLASAIGQTIDKNGHKSCYVRPLIFRGPGTFSLDARSAPTEVIVMTWEWGEYLGNDALENGVDAMVSSWRRPAPDTFPALAKIGGQYINSQLASMEAVDNGFHEAICLDVYGYVSEGPGENIFMVRDGTLFTPPMSASILAGVNRAYVMQLAQHLGLEVREENLTREMLYLCDELFFTGTAVEVTPVRSVDRMPVGSGQPGDITRLIQKNFFEIITGRQPDHLGWLTLVQDLVSGVELTERVA